MKEFEKYLNLEGLKVNEIEETFDENHDECLKICCSPDQTHPKCPVCGSTLSNVQSHERTEIQDVDSGDRRVFLVISYNRYRCVNHSSSDSGVCGKTYHVPIPMIDFKARITTRLRNHMVKDSLFLPFKKVAEQYGCSVMTVSRAVDDWIDEKEKWRKDNLYSPVCMGIDENHLGGRYCLVITDNDQDTLIDILDNKDPETVRKVFEEFKEKENLRVVTMDMCLEYRAAVYEVFGQKVAIVVDHFHVVKLINDALMDVKKNIISKSSFPNGEGLQRVGTLLRKNLESLTDKDKESMSRAFKVVPGLLDAYALKESLRSIWNCKTREDAEKAFENICAAIPKGEEWEPYRSVVKTMNNWRKEIFNFFDYGRVSNGLTECINGLVKKRNRDGNGYGFKAMRGLALYGKSSTAFRPRQDKKNAGTADTDYKPQIVEETENEETVPGQLKFK